MEKPCTFCPQLFTILTVPVFVLLYMFTAIHVLLVLVVAHLNMRRSLYFLLRTWARFSFFLMLKRLRIIGKDHIQPDKKYILVANHASLFDILAIMAFYPNVSFFGREYLIRIPLFGKVLRMIDYVPMRTADLRNTREMLDELRHKSMRMTVAIFPEGSRTRNGEIARFRKGFVHLIRATGYEVLPVTLKGFFSFKPANRFYINFVAPLRVIVHPPLSSDELTRMDDQEIILQVRTIIESAYC